MKIVRDFDGVPLCINDLPAAGYRGYWTAKRKAKLLLAIQGELMSISEAFERYAMTADEIIAWRRDFYPHGINGLRATRLQEYRPPNPDARTGAGEVSAARVNDEAPNRHERSCTIAGEARDTIVGYIEESL